jgi:hypothetical protein
MARLDLGLLWPGYLAAVAFNNTPNITSKSKLTSGMVVSAIVVTGLAFYFFINKQLFGVISPVSGALKSTFPNLTDSSTYWTEHGLAHKAAIAVCFISLVYFSFLLYYRRHTRIITNTEHSLFILSFVFSGFVAYQLIFVNWANTFTWYRLPALVVAAFFIFYILDTIHKSANYFFPGIMKWSPALLLILTSPLFVFRFIDTHLSNEDDFPYSLRVATQWVKSNTPEDAVFALKDTGFFSYFSERNTINLDGLVNSPDYYHDIIEHGLPKHLQNLGVDFFVHQSLADADQSVKSGRYDIYNFSLKNRVNDKPITALRLHKTDEIYRHPYQGGNKILTIWKL